MSTVSDGRDRRGRARDRAAPCPSARRVLMLRVDGAVVRFGGAVAVDTVDLDDRRRGDGRHPRAEWLRQDHPVACHRGLAAARLRPDPLGRRRSLGGAVASPAVRSHVPGVRALPAPQRGRQRRLRAAHGRCRPRRPPPTRRRSARPGWPHRAGTIAASRGLSGGEQQRVALARALAVEPRLLDARRAARRARSSVARATAA